MKLDYMYLWVSIGVVAVFAPLTWVRKIQKFKIGFIFGVFMILVTVVAISIYCFIELEKRDWARPDPNYVALNKDSYWNMIGFSFFMFEGIGSVMPVMTACNEEARSRFPYLLTAALSTLCCTYILFS